MCLKWQRNIVTKYNLSSQNICLVNLNNKTAYQYSNCDLRLFNKIFKVEKFGIASSNLLILMDHLVKTNALFPYNTGLTVVINYFLRDGHIMFSSPIIIILPYHHHRSISLFVGICSKTTANFIIQCYKVLFQQQRTIMYTILDVIKVKKYVSTKCLLHLLVKFA